MDFLRADARKKILRTTMYGDQEFTQWELEIVHTPMFQRLYNLKQLGFSDRVFPDAVHSRLNHVLGVAEMAERMAVRLGRWLDADARRSTTLGYAVDRISSADKPAIMEIPCPQLAKLVRDRTPSIRLMGLLHDITHAAFGHTLEDEVRVFSEKHDDPSRQVRFFDALVAQLFYIWRGEAGHRDCDSRVLDQLAQLSYDPAEFGDWVRQVAEGLTSDQKKVMAARLCELDLAFRLLLRIGFVHHSEARPVPSPEALCVSDAIAFLDPSAVPLGLKLHRDAFMIDMVGNTICADLLDYGRRDPLNAGLKVQFDERLIRYLTVVSVKDDLSPTHEPCLRLALQIFTDKMRYDVLSEMSSVLKARYIINERVIFHPTKCAAGAVLGTAVQLLGISELPPWVQVLGDQDFLARLTDTAGYLLAFCEAYRPGDDLVLALGAIWGNAPRAVELLRASIKGIRGGSESHTLDGSELDRIRDRAAAARRLCWNLAARRFPKLAFRLRTGLQLSGGATSDTIAELYVQPHRRFDLERRVEQDCNLPLGSVVIHCPQPRTSMKAADVLVVGADPANVAKLRDVTNVSPEGLLPYQEEIRAIEEMYKSIWQFHVFVESSRFEKQPVVAWVLERELHFPNDQLLTEELAHERPSVFGLLATDLRDDVAPNLLPGITKRIDADLGSRGWSPEQPEEIKAWLRRIIAETTAGQYLELPVPRPDAARPVSRPQEARLKERKPQKKAALDRGVVLVRALGLYFGPELDKHKAWIMDFGNTETAEIADVDFPDFADKVSAEFQTPGGDRRDEPVQEIQRRLRALVGEFLPGSLQFGDR